MASNEKNTKAEVKEIKSLKELLPELKKKAFETKKVQITYMDTRDINKVTTAYLTCENPYFNLAKIVPLNTVVELEQCLIDCAKEAKILLHLPEVNKEGRETGKHTYKRVPKYSISYM